MANYYYLDIETTGIHPSEHEIITIQYVKLNDQTGKCEGDLKILKSWEIGGEKKLLQEFINDTKIAPRFGDFAFVAVGFNLKFENKFLREKTNRYGMDIIDIFRRPFIDLHQLAILLNGGQIKGSGLDKLTTKPHDGKIIPTWYKDKEYDKIEEYIKDETDVFINFLCKAYDVIPTLRETFEQR